MGGVGSEEGGAAGGADVGLGLLFLLEEEVVVVGVVWVFLLVLVDDVVVAVWLLVVFPELSLVFPEDDDEEGAEEEGVLDALTPPFDPLGPLVMPLVVAPVLPPVDPDLVFPLSEEEEVPVVAGFEEESGFTSGFTSGLFVVGGGGGVVGVAGVSCPLLPLSRLSEEEVEGGSVSFMLASRSLIILERSSRALGS